MFNLCLYKRKCEFARDTDDTLFVRRQKAGMNDRQKVHGMITVGKSHTGVWKSSVGIVRTLGWARLSTD